MANEVKPARGSDVKPQAPAPAPSQAPENQIEKPGIGDTIKNLGKLAGNALLDNIGQQFNNNLNEEAPSNQNPGNNSDNKSNNNSDNKSNNNSDNSSKNKAGNHMQDLCDTLEEEVKGFNDALGDAILSQASKAVDAVVNKAGEVYDNSQKKDKPAENTDADLSQNDSQSADSDKLSTSSDPSISSTPTPSPTPTVSLSSLADPSNPSAETLKNTLEELNAQDAKSGTADNDIPADNAIPVDDNVVEGLPSAPTLR